MNFTCPRNASVFGQWYVCLSKSHCQNWQKINVLICVIKYQTTYSLRILFSSFHFFVIKCKFPFCVRYSCLLVNTEFAPELHTYIHILVNLPRHWGFSGTVMVLLDMSNNRPSFETLSAGVFLCYCCA